VEQLMMNGIRPLSDREFTLFQGLIFREAGIFLSDAKKALVTGRLSRRIRALGLADFASYYERVAGDVEGERTAMLDSICTNETRFFREPKQFDFLDQQVLPEWKMLGNSGAIPKRIRVWSAACSTGEEPYSIAMLLATHFPREEGWQIEIVASDLSTKVLAAATAGVWPAERAADIPESYLKAYMFRGVGSEAGKIRIHPKLESMIEFRQINLNSDTLDLGPKPFDLIFCRNVLIYFNRDSKASVISRLTRHLSPTGLLFLGHAESLNGSLHGLQHAGPTCYRKL
jgi:chemotaxis protein methyltransferase CheR